MPQENPPRSDQFWMAEPLSILIQAVLTKAFNLEGAEIEVATGQVLQYIEFLSQSNTLEEAWQQRSFYELLVENAEAEENAPKSSHELFVEHLSLQPPDGAHRDRFRNLFSRRP